jgi:hypothetical protein
MSHSSDKYEGMFVIVKKPRLFNSKHLFELEIVDKNMRSKYLDYSYDQVELFKMLLSKYIPLRDEGIEKYEYDVPRTPISNEIKFVAEELKRKLKNSIEAPAHASERVNQLLLDVVHDIEGKSD